MRVAHVFAIAAERHSYPVDNPTPSAASPQGRREPLVPRPRPEVRHCIDCGEEIRECFGFVLARDVPAMLHEGIPARERCAYCNEVAVQSRDSAGEAGESASSMKSDPGPQSAGEITGKETGAAPRCYPGINSEHPPLADTNNSHVTETPNSRAPRDTQPGGER